MIVQRPSGRRTSVCIHRQVKRAQQGASQLTVIPTAILFGSADDYHATFDGGNVFFHSAVKKIQYIDIFKLEKKTITAYMLRDGWK